MLEKADEYSVGVSPSGGTPSRGFFRLRLPVQSVEELFEDQGFVIGAALRALVRLENGESMLLVQDYVWIKACGGWACYRISAQGWNRIRMAY